MKRNSLAVTVAAALTAEVALWVWGVTADPPEGDWGRFLVAVSPALVGIVLVAVGVRTQSVRVLGAAAALAGIFLVTFSTLAGSGN